MISRILLVLFVVLALCSGITAQSSSSSASTALVSSSSGSAGVICGGAGYDLSPLVGVDIPYVSGQYTYRLRTCGVVFGNGTGACVGTFCQSTTKVSFYDPAVVTYTAVAGGVLQALANGDMCPGNLPRQSLLYFLCNSTATTPFISYLVEQAAPNICRYNVTIQTSATCTVAGVTRPSPTCGGGYFDLSSITGSDIRIANASASFNYSVRVCGAVTDPQCASVAPTSVCQIGPGGYYSLSRYTPGTTEVVYSQSSNGLDMIMATGDMCGASARVADLRFQCVSTATSPILVSVTEPSTCRYIVQIQTNAVCQSLATSSSGGGVIVPASGVSSSSAGVTPSLSSSVSVNIGSSSSVARSSAGSSSASPVSSSAPVSVSSSAAAVSSSARSSSAAVSSSATPVSSSARSSSAAVSSSASLSSSAPTILSSSATRSSSAASSAAPAAANSSSSSAPGVVAGQSSSSTVVFEDSSSSSNSFFVDSSSSTGSIGGPGGVNGASSFVPSMIALLIVVVALIGQF